MSPEQPTSLPSARLAAAGLALPTVPAPVAAYVPAKAVSGQIVTSGQLPFVDGTLAVTGKVGAAVSVEVAADLARTAALNAVAAAAAVAGGLDRIHSVTKLVVYVASDASFTGQPAVANGASDVLQVIFGEAGRHARSAVGVAVLPLDAPVELELTVEVVPD